MRVCARLYDMSLGNFYRFPSTEISGHFSVHVVIIIQGGSNMTGTICV